MTDKYDLIFSIAPACKLAYNLPLIKIGNVACLFDWIGNESK